MFWITILIIIASTLLIKFGALSIDVPPASYAVAVILEMTFELQKENDKQLQSDNPNRAGIDFMISQIYDLTITAIR